MGGRIGIAIHGSTGSIGTQTLDVIERLRGRSDFEVVALVCNSNIELLEQQILRHKPRYAVVADEERAALLRQRMAGRTDTEILGGEKHATDICAIGDVGFVMIGTSGFAGLAPTLKSIEAGKRVAVANKEAFLTAGKLIWDAAKRHGVEVLPVDSEPSAIWQCLEPIVWSGESERRSAIWQLHRGAGSDIDHLLLTCSGGPFLRQLDRDMSTVTPAEALKHPTWNMGPLITIRSATWANKGMEIIELSSIFNVRIDQVKVVVHPQSRVHSGVQLVDGTQIVQQGANDMRYPISYSMSFPARHDIGLEKLSLPKVGQFEFIEPDEERFPYLRIARRAGKLGGTAPAVLNGADEKAVALFLAGRIEFPQMAELVEEALNVHQPRMISDPSLEQILVADRWARQYVDGRVAEERPLSGRGARRTTV